MMLGVGSARGVGPWCFVDPVSGSSGAAPLEGRASAVASGSAQGVADGGAAASGAGAAEVAQAAASAVKVRRRLWMLLTLAAGVGFVVATPYLLPLYRTALAK